MNYEQAKAKKKALELANKAASEALNVFPKTSMGLIPDSVKATKEYQEAKEKSVKAFAELQAFNMFFVKTFKKEYAADRKAKYSA